MRIDPTFQLPDNVSTSSASFDDAYYFIYWVSVVFFVAIVGAMCWFAYKYRKRPGHKPEPTGHNMVLEVAWTVAPIFLLIYLFHVGFKGYMDLAVAPADAIEIRVRASQWNWSFEYPNGESDPDGRLHIPEGKNVKLVMTSGDVLHAFYVPELRTKRDLVPGMYTNAWFNAARSGTWTIYCAEYCGGRNDTQKNDVQARLLDGKAQTGHWAMLSEVEVQPYDKWKQYVDGLGSNVPEEIGLKVYNRVCKSCHSVDGTKLAGPSWKGIFGKEEATSAGPVKVDENYLRESILEPNAKVVTGFAPAMPTFKGQLKEKEIDGLIAYIKSLK